MALSRFADLFIYLFLYILTTVHNQFVRDYLLTRAALRIKSLSFTDFNHSLINLSFVCHFKAGQYGIPTLGTVLVVLVLTVFLFFLFLYYHFVC